jgi:hypothetical protein
MRRASAQPRFFAAMAAVLLIIVLIGFAPTLYLRAFFDVRSIGVVLALHGCVMTAWYVLLFIQTMFVAADRVDLHRRLGAVGAFLAIGIVALGIVAHAEVVSRSVDSSDATVLASLSALVWIDTVALVAFCLCVALALLFRKNSAVHKRLMLLASISTVGPALARIAGWSSLEVMRSAFVPGVTFALLIALVAYDLIGRRRGRLVSILGASLVFTMFTVAIAASVTPFGLALTRSLG